jgi:hypothetical protein
MFIVPTKTVPIKIRTLIKVVIVVELKNLHPALWETIHDQTLDQIYSNLDAGEDIPRGVDHEMDAIDDLCAVFGGTHLTSSVGVCLEDDDLLKSRPSSSESHND